MLSRSGRHAASRFKRCLSRFASRNSTPSLNSRSNACSPRVFSRSASSLPSGNEIPSFASEIQSRFFTDEGIFSIGAVIGLAGTAFYLSSSSTDSSHGNVSEHDHHGDQKEHSVQEGHDQAHHVTDEAIDSESPQENGDQEGTEDHNVQIDVKDPSQESISKVESSDDAEGATAPKEDEVVAEDQVKDAIESQSTLDQVSEKDGKDVVSPESGSIDDETAAVSNVDSHPQTVPSVELVDEGSETVLPHGEATAVVIALEESTEEQGTTVVPDAGGDIVETKVSDQVINPESREQAVEEPVVDETLDEQVEVPECGFCKFMKAGPCGKEFSEWEKCTQDADKEEKDIFTECLEKTQVMKECVEAHPEYYASVLEAEAAIKKAEAEAAEQEATEKEEAAAAAAASGSSSTLDSATDSEELSNQEPKETATPNEEGKKREEEVTGVQASSAEPLQDGKERDSHPDGSIMKSVTDPAIESEALTSDPATAEQISQTQVGLDNSVAPAPATPAAAEVDDSVSDDTEAKS